ncbi:hypothetical protein QOZ80_1BG0093660 [Eleusine coracana subsp. coracana]|nr:hypothetical protein QOZ80_1BG0093660 [Eleusine coracana subsp. coracana]
MPPSPGDPVPSWLKSLPVAPEFRPTAAEFADPVAYILKIEPAAAPFGICKVVPPHPPPPKRTTLANLTRSFAALHPDDPSPTFPSRHQQLGLCPRRPRPAIKPVWQSSHRYTLPQFEAKAGATRKVLLSHLNVPASRQLSLLDVEALFWCAMADRPVTVEYASDMAGSGFGPCAARPRAPAAAHGSVGDTAWNMRGVARSPGSLLRFLREDVPGVTSPMLYVAMMFSWFAWHVEDHDLHSVNYMHSGAPKTWYGVPGDAALALEDVVRVHGYGGELNSLETFAMLGNKTTVMSPEVLVELGIPCCRLVQNAGEFVITFPGAYHSGFSHGFNCGEASNIATPEWLRVAKEAAVRRASINRPPMVSHYQLLYELAMSMCLSLINNQLVGSGGSNLEDAFRSGDTGTNGILPPLNRNSALDLLASAYGDHSDPDKDVPNKMHKVSNDSNKVLSPRAESQCNTSSVGAFDGTKVSTSSKECQQGSFSQSSQCISKPSIPNGPKGVRTRNKYKLKLMLSEGFPTKDIYSATQEKVHFEPPSSNNASTEPIPDTNFDASHNIKDSSTEPFSVDGNRSSTVTNNLFIPILKPDKDSSRMHVFCLEHAAEVEKQLQTIGGAHVILLCRPEYPKVEAEARLLSEEMEFDYDWKDIHFREASMEDRKKIQEVVQDEETIPTNSDWAVKLGINLYYSANLAKSPLYKKQLPYNRVIYKAFGCTSPDNSPVKLKTYARRQGRQKKVVLAGRWCGKVWMSNQVHPYLAHRTESHEPEETDEICSDQLDQKTKGEPVDNSSREAASTGKRAVEEKSSKREQEPLEKLTSKKPKLDQKTKGEPVDNSSREAASMGKRAVEEKSSKREQEPLEKLNSKKPKPNEEDSSKGLEGAAEVFTINSRSRTVVEKANTKKPEHTEEDNSEALKGAAEASCLIPTEVVLRSSTRIANRKDKLKSKMKKEDNDPASALQPMVKEDNDGPASHLRARSPTQKAKVDMKKQLKRTRGKEHRTPTDLKDQEQQPSDAKGCLTSSDTKHQLSVRKKETKVGTTQEAKRAKRRAPSPPEHVEEYKCDIEGCPMSFGTNQELSLHKRDICPVKGCRKKFFSHKYLLQHRKVHADARPLKCPWKDCKMTFKWQWARTEHVRVHTGDRPYVCHEPGCEQTFRFVSDFSRHKRRTGHLDKAVKTK